MIETAQDAVGFAAFVTNAADPLHVFHDSVCHRRCVQSHPMGSEAARWSAAVNDISRGCDACRRPFVTFDLVPFGFLTSNQASPLYAFNTLRFHEACLTQWPERSTFCDLLAEAIRTEAASGRGIRWLAAQVCIGAR